MLAENVLGVLHLGISKGPAAFRDGHVALVDLGKAEENGGVENGQQIVGLDAAISQEDLSQMAAMLNREVRGQTATEASFRHAAQAELETARPLRDNAFKVPLASNVLVRCLLNLSQAAR